MSDRIINFESKAERAIVRIVMPVFNGERFLEEAIKSIIDQIYRNWELVIVDDGSQDGSVEIVRQFMALDERIKLIRQNRGGPEAARQKGFEGCRSEYVARMDCDDKMTSDRIEKQVVFLDAHPDTVAVGGQIKYLSEDGKKTGFPSGWPLEHDGILGLLFCCKGAICNATIMCRSAVCAKIKLPDYGGPGADIKFILDMAQYGKIANLHDVVHLVRIHSSSIQSSRNPMERVERTWFAVKSAKNAQPGLPAPSFEDFHREWESRPLFTKLSQKSEVLLGRYSRKTMWYFLNGPVIPHGFFFAAVSAVISPMRILRRIVGMFKRGQWKSLV